MLTVAGSSANCAARRPFRCLAAVRVKGVAVALALLVSGLNASIALRQTHPRIDMTFVWPSLTPPDPSIKPQPGDTPDVTDRLFVTIAAGDSTLPPLERFKVIYPRYLDAAPLVGTDGLSTQLFRDGTAYQGEDLIHDPSRPEQFLLRCTRITSLTPPMCLHERRIGGADITVRFPRDWLLDWRTVSEGIERLIAGFKPQV